MTTPEQKTQMAILQWLHLYHPLASKLVIRIGNEGKRTVAGHVVAKKMGLHVGASDFFIAYPTIQYYGCFVEVKPDRWKCSGKKEEAHINRQQEFIGLVKSQGYAGRMVKGVDEGLKFISDYLTNKPL